MKGIIRTGIVITLFVALIQGKQAEGGDLYFIDAHSQVDQPATMPIVLLQTVKSPNAHSTWKRKMCAGKVSIWASNVDYVIARQ